MQLNINKINQTIESFLNIQDLNIQSSILCLEEFYKEINSVSKIEIQAVQNSRNLHYLFYKADEKKYIGMDFFSDTLYEPFFIPIKGVSRYYKEILSEFNKIIKPDDRFEYYREVYSKFHKSDKSLDFLKTIDFLKEQHLSNQPYPHLSDEPHSITNNLRELIKEDSYNIPTFFSSYDNCCKLNKYGGINEDIYDELASDYFEVKIELLYFINEAAINLNLFNNTFIINDIYNHMDTLQKIEPTLYDNIVTLTALKSKIDNILEEHLQFNALNCKEISLFNKKQCEEYLKDYFQDLHLDDKINSFLNKIQISQEKNLLDNTINSDSKKLKNRL